MNTSVLTLACLCAGLLFDPIGFLRLTLAASFIHETGHILFYIICKFKLPKLNITAAGIALNSTQDLSVSQDFVVTCGGPLFNFATAFILLLLINVRATYLLYFFMTINVCIGAYNLLPIGILDGARLISLIENGCKAKYLYTAKKCVIFSFSVALICFAVFTKTTFIVKMGLLTSSVYLLCKS